MQALPPAPHSAPCRPCRIIQALPAGAPHSTACRHLPSGGSPARIGHAEGRPLAGPLPQHKVEEGAPLHKLHGNAQVGGGEEGLHLAGHGGWLGMGNWGRTSGRCWGTLHQPWRGTAEGLRGEVSEGQPLSFEGRTRAAAAVEGRLLKPSRVRRAAAACSCMAGSWPCRSKRVQRSHPLTRRVQAPPPTSWALTMQGWQLRPAR